MFKHIKRPFGFVSSAKEYEERPFARNLKRTFSTVKSTIQSREGLTLKEFKKSFQKLQVSKLSNGESSH